MSLIKSSNAPVNERLWGILLACYWAVIFIGSHFPSDGRQATETHFDKVMHFVAFGILAVLTARYADARGFAFGWRTWLAIWSIVFAYGVVDELTQPLVGRGRELYDLIADGIGAACGLACYRYYRMRRRSPLTA